MRAAKPAHHRGVALITALLLTFLATSAVVVTAARQRDGLQLQTELAWRSQAVEYLIGLEHWGIRRLLADPREVDSLLDGWVQPLTDTTIPGGEIRGHIVDLSGRFNLNSLMPAGGDGDRDRDAPPRHVAPAVSAAVDGARPAPHPDDPGYADFYDYAPPSWFVQDYVDEQAARRSERGGSYNGGVGSERVEISRTRFRRLLKILGLDPDLSDAVQDWLDRDVQPRFPHGAEDDYYLGLRPAYRAGNGPFAHVSELLLVRGITPEIYHRLRPYVTVLPPNSPINVNTAPVPVLRSLAGGFDAGTVRRIVEHRRRRPFRSIGELEALLAGEDLQLEPTGLAVNSHYFRVDGAVTIGGQRTSRSIRLLRTSAGKVVLLGRENGDGVL